MGRQQQYNPCNILLTGGAGFVGSHVCNFLFKTHPHYHIVVLDKLDYCSNLKNLRFSLSSPNFTFIHGDVCDIAFLRSLLASHSVDTVLHFAAQTHVDNSFHHSLYFILNNVYGSGSLLLAAAATGVRRFVHVSTDEVYGESFDDERMREDSSLLRPTNPYAATKAGSEMLAMAAAKSLNLKIITTRGNNIYGPFQFPEKLIPKLTLLGMRGEKLPIHGDGSNLRSFLYAEDVAEAFDVILHWGEDGEVYNVGAKVEKRVIEVARDICKILGVNHEKMIDFVDDRPHNDRRYLIDDRKLRELGWREKTEWEEGLRKTVEWYRENGGSWWSEKVISRALVPHPWKVALANGDGDDGGLSKLKKLGESEARNRLARSRL